MKPVIVFIVGALTAGAAVGDEPAKPTLNPAVTQATIAETICTTGWTRTVRPYVADMKGIKAEMLAAIGEPIERRIEPGLQLYVDEDLTGVEYEADGRYIDVLAVDKDGGFVVIELKVSRGYDRVIGQLLRYMAWVQKSMETTRPVRGVIVANEISMDFKLACSLIVDVRLIEYEIAFTLRPV